MTNKKRGIYIGLSVLLLAVLTFTGIMYFNIKGNKIAKNTYINEVNVGGMTKEEALDELLKKYDIKEVDFMYLDKSWKIDKDDISLLYQTKEAVEDAYNLNRRDSFGSNILKTAKTIFGEKNNINIGFKYNEDKLEEDIKKIAGEIDIDVKDASISISGSNINITDETTGLKVNIEDSISSFKDNLEKGIVKTELVVEKLEAKIKKGQLESIDTLLGSHSTKFDGGVSGRNTNIKLAADRTSNVVVMPGENFSYNEHTGLRNIANGYKNAPVIVQGVVQEGVGGGVCQVSTTLYNATLYAGLEYVSLKNHSIPSSYAEKGRDATVADGSIDFIFKNNLNHPIYLRNYVSGNTVTCQIYGSSEDKQNIEIVTNTDGVSVAPVKKVDDPSLPLGQEKVLEKGRDAYTVSTYRVYKDNTGKVLRKEKVSTSYYPKKQGVIAVGTMEAIPTPQPEQPPVVEPTTPPEQNVNQGTVQPAPPVEQNKPQ